MSTPSGGLALVWKCDVLLTFWREPASVMMLEVRRMTVKSHPMCFDLEDINIIFLLNVGKNPNHVASVLKTKLKLMCNFRSVCTVATHLVKWSRLYNVPCYVK